jgi:hypothetical protein
LPGAVTLRYARRAQRALEAVSKVVPAHRAYSDGVPMGVPRALRLDDPNTRNDQAR